MSTEAPVSAADPGAISKARDLIRSLKPKQRARHKGGAENFGAKREREAEVTWDYGRRSKGDARPVRPATRQAVEKMLEILRDSEHLTVHHLQQLKKLLERCSPGEQVCSVLDRRGYDLVQRSVIQNSCDFLECLVKKGLHVDKVRRACSSPLHLACKFGHCDVLRLLLNNGADVTFRSTACYPCYHYVMHDVSGSIHCSTTCHSKFTPLQIALIYDKDDVVQLLLQHEASTRKLDTSRIVLEACQRGAEKSLAHLVSLFPSQATHRDSAGESLLSVAFNKSESCGRLLLESGLQWSDDVMLNCSSKQTSLLHVLYRSHSIDRPYEISKLAFQAGFKRAFVNAKDRAGNGPLHLLLRQVGRRTAIPCYVPQSERDPLAFQQGKQEERDDEIFNCIKLLVQSGADLDAVNNSGEGVLHLLLRNDFYRTLYGMSTSYYCGVLPEINRVLEYLLTVGVDANAECDQVSSPLTWAAHVLCSMEAPAVEVVWPQVWCLFKILFDHGADPNMRDEKGISTVTLMLTAANRWMTQCTDNVDRAQRVLRCMAELLSQFFTHGFDPSDDVLDLCVKQIAILCNVSPMDRRYLLGVRGLMLPFVVNGHNPNDLHLVTESNAVPRIPCRLHGQFYLSRAFIIHRDHAGMFDFFTVLENTLNQDSLGRLVGSMCQILSSNFEENPHRDTGGCINSLKKRCRRVRPLKTLCRITVANCMAWQLKERAPCLPLPPQLKNYIKNI